MRQPQRGEIRYPFRIRYGLVGMTEFERHIGVMLPSQVESRGRVIESERQPNLAPLGLTFSSPRYPGLRPGLSNSAPLGLKTGAAMR